MKHNSKTNYYASIGPMCKAFREEMGLYITELASEVCTSPSNIVKFEAGQNDNYNILIVYLKHGFDLEKAIEVIEHESFGN